MLRLAYPQGLDHLVAFFLAVVDAVFHILCLGAGDVVLLVDRQPLSLVVLVTERLPAP